MILEIAIEFSKEKPERQEMFKLKNKECHEVFKKETEINAYMLKCFENDLPIEIQSKKWLKTFNSILEKSEFVKTERRQTVKKTI